MFLGMVDDDCKIRKNFDKNKATEKKRKKEIKEREEKQN